MRHRYARGYVSSIINNAPGYSEEFIYSGDPTLESFIISYPGERNSKTTWQYARTMLDIALWLIGLSFKDWMVFNIQKNSGANPCTQAFLLDTVNYILTGKRCQGIPTWLEFHSHSEGTKAPYKDFGNAVLARQFANTPDSELYAKWISHPDGVVDMSEFLRLCFGRNLTKPTEKP